MIVSNKVHCFVGQLSVWLLRFGAASIKKIGTAGTSCRPTAVVRSFSALSIVAIHSCDPSSVVSPIATHLQNQLVTLFVTEFTNLKLPEFLKRWDTINRQRSRDSGPSLAVKITAPEMLEQYIKRSERTAG